MDIPTLSTDRLTLRPFRPDDAAAVQRLAGDRAIASTTLTIPHPYEEGMAEKWIGGHAGSWIAKAHLTLAITTVADGLVGAISLDLILEHKRAELGYWVGVPFWGRGYATEAGQAILDYGFSEIGLNRIEALYLLRNPASGRVLEKLGMKHEGVRREHIVKWGTPEDIGLYAVLAADR